MKLNVLRIGSVALLYFASFTVWAIGNEGSGGGSASAAEFSDIGYNVVKVIEKLPIFPVTAEVFNSIILTTHVEFVDESLRDSSGLEVDALNFPQKGLIKVNLDRWRGLLLAPVQKYQLVVHEYLGILKIDDSEYRVSRLILDNGVTLNSLVCKFAVSDSATGILTWYMLDTSGSGMVDNSLAKFTFQSNDGKLDFSVPASVAIASRGGELGYGVSWSAFGLGEITYISYQQLTTPGTFSTSYFVNSEFDSLTGAPKYIEKGALSCTVVKH